jgi:hypothetical protein
MIAKAQREGKMHRKKIGSQIDIIFILQLHKRLGKRLS